MKKFNIFLITNLILVSINLVFADNSIKLRTDQITFFDGTIQVSSPPVSTVDLNTKVPYTGASSDVDLNGYDIRVGSITGYGGGLTGIVSGIDLSDQGVFEVNDSTWMNLGTGLTLSGSTIFNDARQIYSIVVATYSAPGIDYVCDGTADEVQIQQAITAAGVNGVVYVSPGFYYMAHCASFTATGQQLISNGAVLYIREAEVALGIASVLYLNYANCVVSGFVFEGTGSTYTNRAFIIDSNGDYWTVRNCLFANMVAHTNGVVFSPQSGADAGQMTNCSFNNISTNYSVVNYSNRNYYTNLRLYGSGGGYFDMRGNYNFINGFFSNVVTSYSFYPSGIGNTVTNFFIENSQANAVLSGCVGLTLSNGYIYNMSDEGIELYGADCVINNVTFDTIGGSGDNSSAITFHASSGTVKNCTFKNNIDAYAVSIDANLTGINIEGNNFSNMTGNVGTINNGGYRTFISNNVPYTLTTTLQNPTTFYANVTMRGYVQFVSSTTEGLYGTTPSEKGQTYWNTDTNEFWVSTGTAINQFIHK